MKAYRCFAALLLASGLSSVQADTVQVAVAANVTVPMQKIAAAFELDTGHQARLALGSTGRFYAQIRNGAPFQLLLAADAATPQRLQDEGLGVAGTRFTYATGRLVLWSAQHQGVDAQGSVLRLPPRGKLAVADPKLAPYGAAALQTLTALGVLDAWRPQLVQGESIAQAYQFVASGNAPLGLVALSQVAVDGRITSGSGWVVPAHLHDPLRQDAIVLLPGKDHAATQALARYLRSDKARAILRSHGYDL